MKILWISPKLPFPLDSGDKIRQYSLIKQLSENHSIYLLSFLEKPEDVRYIPEIKKFCTAVETVVLPSRFPFFKRVLTAGSSMMPFVARKYLCDEMQRRIMKLMSEVTFDVVQIEHVYMGSYFEGAHGCRGAGKLLTMHNIESLLYKRQADVERSIAWKAYWYFEYLKLARYERRILSMCDAILAMSEIDKALLCAKHPGIRSFIVPNTVDVSGYEISEDEVEPHLLMFSGSMNYPPNQDAVLFFCRDIFPRIKRRIPEAKFYVVGKRPPNSFVSLENSNDVVITGYVDDVKPYLRKTSVFVVPLRAGGGTRLKILEAMAMGKPVVSTGIGAEGLKVNPGGNILIADEPEDFASKVARLLKDSSLREKIGGNGRKLVEQRYNSKIAARTLEHAYNEIANLKKSGIDCHISEN